MRALFLMSAIALPILDIASLITVGGRLGVWPTVAVVLLAAVAGSVLVRMQGFSLLSQARQTLAAGRFPAREVFDGACVLIGGGLLMFPGFVSDALGLMLLTPLVRTALRRVIGAAALRRHERWTPEAEPAAAEPRGAERRPDGPVIDGEFRPLEADGLPQTPAEKNDVTPSNAGAPSQAPSPRRSRGSATVVQSEDP